ncbi:molecular chaperone [Piscinibacter sp. HJYY11]|uniref:fimbrial biogenesis chaperone n=1 Tax=Piscinibacter sp. HJYY11 TaxID=2801333 RepID=UPI00191EC53D|nr:fimbria/pilus periplasmic chaperone [Piscinibacter sp. HJYY11]MBL0729511.1 molecular chaperone [Piscinibacter sp. HJYY11]
MLFIRLLALSLTAAVLPAWADVGLPVSATPGSMYIQSGNSSTSVLIVNRSGQDMLLHAEAIAWRREGGADRDAPTKDLAIDLPVFALAPGGQQTVRITLRGPAASDQEMAYRMVLRELPATNAGPATARRASAAARAAMTLRVPVYVSPALVRRQQQWQAHIDDDGQLVAKVANLGNVHYKVGGLRVLGDTQPPIVISHPSQSVLFPGEARTFRLLPPTVPTHKPISLEVRTEFGVQYVALDLSVR